MAFGFRSSKASRQAKPTRAQPKFPRQRSAGQRVLGRVARLVVFGLVAVGLLLFFLGEDGQEPVVAVAQMEESRPDAQVETPIGVEARENINLAGITRPGRAASPAPNEGQDAAASGRGADAGSSQTQSPATQTRSGQAVAGQAQKPADDQSARPSAQPEIRLYAPAGSREKAEIFGNPWGIPYVGYALEDVADVLKKKYSPIKVESISAPNQGIMETLPEGARQGKTLALTLGAFDTGQVFDNDLLALVRQEKIPVTLFVSSRWAVANAQTLMNLAQEPLVTIAGHGKQFRPCSVDGKLLGVQGATGSVLELLQEVEGNARDLQRIASVRPAWFQGADGVYDRVALSIIRQDLGFGVAGHSLALNQTGGDTPDALARALTRAKDRDIIYSPLGQSQGALATGLRQALPDLKKAGFAFVPLPAPTPDK